MRILSWNVNGLRTLNQYYPWSITKSHKDILEGLKADIICFQEVKCPRNKIDADIAMIPGYDAYFSFSKTKLGYSGVVTYVKQFLIPIGAEEGITGTLYRNLDSISTNTTMAEGLVGYHLPTDKHDYLELMALDAEGRCVILDLGLFVLFNVYCPNESNEERLPFKLLFHQVLEERVAALREAGREVIVVGDLNTLRDEIDHCDPKNSLKEYGIQELLDHPARMWFDNWLSPKGPMIDLCREYFPDRKGMYTCWNTKINARPSNYGTRIDYILVTSGLLPWFQAADIQPDVLGSDHCPIFADMREEITLEDHTLQQLRNKLSFSSTGQNKRPPALCARYYEEFSSKQQRLSAWFSKPGEAAMLQRKDSNISEISEKDDDAVPEVYGTPTTSTNSPSVTLGTPLTLLPIPSLPTAMQVSPAVHSSSTSSSHSISISSNRPSTAKQSKTKSISSKNQPTLMSFFKPPLPTANSEVDITPVSNEAITTPSADLTRQSRPVVQNTDDDLPDEELLSTAAMLSNNDAIKNQWDTLFTPKEVPLCRLHGEPCTAYTVNKKGPNKGRRFWLCSKPTGPRAPRDSEGRELRTEFRCEFFCWDNSRGRVAKRNLTHGNSIASGEKKLKFDS